MKENLCSVVIVFDTIPRYLRIIWGFLNVIFFKAFCLAEWRMQSIVLIMQII